MSTQNGCSPATFLIETESRNTEANSEQNIVMMASDGPSPHSPSLRLGLLAPQPSRRRHAQSLLGPSFHDPRTHYVLESHPSKPRLSPAATMSDDTPSALTPPLHCASILQPATPPQVTWVCCFVLLNRYWGIVMYVAGASSWASQGRRTHNPRSPTSQPTLSPLW